MHVALTLAAVLLARHPIHSSSASLTLAPGERNVTVALRVFADDFPPGHLPAAIEGYLRERFRLTDRAGRPIALRLDAVRAEGLTLTLTLRAPVSEGLSGVRVWFGVLAERFSDQVNILQARYGGRTVSLLFTASDGPKPLP
ncbi:MAG TPA: DUF6702 family protein [Gemmatimonadales bacterium]|nr:DUF6702 family protein [Gemmatimonadales bacterium]